jgi:enoyl-CoA hydratase/carnithine racemase
MAVPGAWAAKSRWEPISGSHGPGLVAQPEINLGIITGGGASQRLPRVVGQAKAMEMILTGMPIDAAEAYRCGLVSRVVAPGELEAAGAQIAKQILNKSPLMTKGRGANLARPRPSDGHRPNSRRCEAFATDD